MSWIDYWNGKPTLYVSDRHRAAHDQDIAAGIELHLPPAPLRVLDFGCGDTTAAARIAAACEKLFLWDAAPAIRTALRARYAAMPNIAVLEPGDLAALPPSSIALTVMSSVVQYMTPDMLAAALTTIRAVLAPDGKLVVADVIPPGIGPAQDAWQLLAYAARRRFLTAAAAGLVRTAASPYRATRAHLGLAKYTADELLGVLARHGYRGTRLPLNFGHNQRRMAFSATLASHVPGAGVMPAAALSGDSP